MLRRSCDSVVVVKLDLEAVGEIDAASRTKAHVLTALFLIIVLLPTAPLSADDTPTTIFVMKTDGSQVRKVAQVAGYKKHGSPQWSHDGKRLAFDAYEGPDDAKKFFAIQLDG